MTCVLVATVLVAAFSISPSDAQRGRGSGNAPVPDKLNAGNNVERLNANNVAIAAGDLDDTNLSIARDLSAVLDDGDDFRVLPVLGNGGGQAIRDVRFLRRVALGITQSRLLDAFRRSNEIGPIGDEIAYVAKLFNEEMHVVVRADSGVDRIEGLAGKKVNVGLAGSGTQLTARDILARLSIKVDEVNLGQALALEQLKAGTIAATVMITGRPAPGLSKIRADDGLRLLRLPFARTLQDAYLPASLTHADYPAMVAGDDIETVAVGAVLIAHNWPQGSDHYRRIETFVQRFFPKLAELQKPPHHPKWREVNLAATLPGWTRFPAAEAWLANNRAQLTAATRDQFNQFLAASGGGAATSPAERERLFKDFVMWKQSRERQ